jgi:hypothetical protein
MMLLMPKNEMTEVQDDLKLLCYREILFCCESKGKLAGFLGCLREVKCFDGAGVEKL